MIPYEIYKIVHIAGIMALYLSLGALIFAGAQGLELNKKIKRPWLIIHGVSLFFILLGGFGLLARLGINGAFPLWVWLKLAVWLILGAVVGLLIKKPSLSKALFAVCLFMGVAAAYYANYKPL